MARPTARVLALLELLQSGGEVQPVRQLAERLGVDERTVRRYVEHLLELEVPVESVRGRHGGYRLGVGYRLPPLMLTEDEAVVAVVGLSVATRIGLHGEGAAAQSAAAKIRRVLPAALGRRVKALLDAAAQTPTTPAEAAAASSVLLTTAEAAHNRCPVRLRYIDRNGRASTRTMLPWGLAAHRGRWYVTGPDLKSGEHRTFRLDRVVRVEVETGRFDVPASFDPRQHVLSELAQTPWRHDVSLLLQADPAQIQRQLPQEVARSEAVTRSGSRESHENEGWTRVQLRAERLEWVAAAIAALDVPYVVERPDALRDELLALAQRLAARAQAPASPRSETAATDRL